MSSAEAAPTSMRNSSAVSVGSSSDLGAAPARSSQEITVGDAHAPKIWLNRRLTRRLTVLEPRREQPELGRVGYLVVSQSQTMSVPF